MAEITKINTIIVYQDIVASSILKPHVVDFVGNQRV